MSEIGFIGAGEMGSPMIERLIAGSHTVTVYARNPERIEWCRALGTDIAPSAQAAAAKADIVILCLYSDAQVLGLMLGDNSPLDVMRPGSAVVIHTTGSPVSAARVAERAQLRGIGVIDAPVSGTRRDIAAGSITLLVGGAEAVVERCRPILQTYADPILHIGPLGAGQLVKLANNLLFAANIALAQKTSQILSDFGCDPHRGLQAITHCSGSTAVIAMADAAGGIDSVAIGARRFIDKDLTTCAAVATDMRADLGLLGATAMAAMSASPA